MGWGTATHPGVERFIVSPGSMFCGRSFRIVVLT